MLEALILTGAIPGRMHAVIISFYELSQYIYVFVLTLVCEVLV
jgi:hypothetical protein